MEQQPSSSTSASAFAAIASFDILPVTETFQGMIDSSAQTLVDSTPELFQGNSSTITTDFQSTQNQQEHGPSCFCSQCVLAAFPDDDTLLEIFTFLDSSGSDEKMVELEEDQPVLASTNLNDGESGSETPTIPLDVTDYQNHMVQVIIKSPQELALENLQSAMTLLSHQARLNFRDALYRLADTSRQRHKRSGVGIRNGASSSRTPTLPTHQRSSGEENQSCTKMDRAMISMLLEFE